MNRDEMMKRIRADAFPANNGSVLTCINLLNRSGFSPLEQVRVGVKNWGVEKPEFLDSIHFLIWPTTIMTNWKQGRRKRASG